MNPVWISVWTRQLPLIAPTLIVHVATIGANPASPMRAGAYVERCKIARYLSMPLFHISGMFLSAVIGEAQINLRRFLDKPPGKASR